MKPSNNEHGYDKLRYSKELEKFLITYSSARDLADFGKPCNVNDLTGLLLETANGASYMELRYGSEYLDKVEDKEKREYILQRLEKLQSGQQNLDRKMDSNERRRQYDERKRDK